MSLLLDPCPKPLSTLVESSEASVEAELFVSEFLETALKSMTEEEAIEVMLR